MKDRIQCPNCKNFKVISEAGIGCALAICSFIFFIVGIIIFPFLIVGVLVFLTGTLTFIIGVINRIRKKSIFMCVNCHNKFNNNI